MAGQQGREVEDEYYELDDLGQPPVNEAPNPDDAEVPPPDVIPRRFRSNLLSFGNLLRRPQNQQEYRVYPGGLRPRIMEGPAEPAEPAEGGQPRQQSNKNILQIIATCIILSIVMFFVFRSYSSISISEDKPTYPEYSGRPMDDIIGDKKLKLSFAVVPDMYDLTIIPILDEGNNTIIGKVLIRLNCTNETTLFRLHTSESILRIYNVSITDATSKALLELHHTRFGQDKDFYEIYIKENLQPNNTYLLHMMFISLMSNASIGTGLFKGYYMDPLLINKTRWIAISNLSPTFARTVFPCFDIPGLKASFKINIGRKLYMQSHTNNKRYVTVPIAGMPDYVLDEYDTIDSVSTYTVAIMVTDFVNYTLESSNRVTFRVISRKEVQKNTKYITSIIPQLVNQMEKLTGAEYTLKKLDVIVVPQLGYSAMENWGLIAIREDFIIVNENSPLIKQNKQLKKFALAHEIAHQWFGNMITPSSWSEVWIKEGFSFFFAYKALAMIDPSWVDSYLFSINQHLVFAPWLTNSEYPLRRPLNGTSKIQNIFTEWLYLKSNSIVNMLFHSLGNDLFFRSVKQLFKWYSNQNPNQDILSETFQYYIPETGFFPPNVTIKYFLESWTDQVGFPIVHINRNFDQKTVTATQSPFPYSDVKDKSSNLWIIPLSWTTQDKPNFNTTTPKVWLTEKTTQLQDPSFDLSFSDDMWILANVNQTGPYRVNYDEENWNLLLNYYDTFPKLTRMQLIGDAIAIAEAGLVEYKVAWLFLEKLKDERDLFMWSVMIKTELQYLIRNLYMNTSFRYIMSILVNNVYNSVDSRLALTTDDEQMEFEDDILKFACSMDHEACLKKAYGLVQGWLEFGESRKIPERFKSWAYCAAMKTASEIEWYALLSRYEGSPESDQTMIAAGLGCYHNYDTLRRYLVSSVNAHNVIRSVDVEPIFLSTATNRNGFDVSKWLLLNLFQALQRRVNNSDAIMNKMVIKLSQYASTRQDLRMFESLEFVKNDTLEICKDNIKRNMRWREKYEKKFYIFEELHYQMCQKVT